jgi:hypothetical protein
MEPVNKLLETSQSENLRTIIAKTQGTVQLCTVPNTTPERQLEANNTRSLQERKRSKRLRDGANKLVVAQVQSSAAVTVADSHSVATHASVPEATGSITAHSKFVSEPSDVGMVPLRRLPDKLSCLQSQSQTVTAQPFSWQSLSKAGKH